MQVSESEVVKTKDVASDLDLIEKQLANLRFSTSDPPEVQRRIKAMKRLQVELLEAECDFFKDLHELESKYSGIYKKICDKRSSIINGKHEPTEEECAFCLPGDEADETNANETGGQKDQGDTAATGPKEPVVGIPRFWLTVFQNVAQIAEMIEEHDIPILEHLEDVKVELTKNPLGFQLDFHFAPNAYFTNTVLTKSYEMRCKVDDKEPFTFEGPEIIKSTGCTINWKDGKNVTVHEVKKKQKHKQSGAIRMVTKLEPCASFFNFFSPPQSEEEEEDGEMDRMTTDFQIGQYLRERVVPRAVLYYTGEIPVSDDEDDEDYSTEADSDEDDAGSESGTTGPDEEKQDTNAD